MSEHSTPPPFDAWLSVQAWQQTWWAQLDPRGTGRRLREQRLRTLMSHALHASPLYARRAPLARGLDDFEPVGKTELMQHFDDWATDRQITHRGVEAALASADNVAQPYLGRYLAWTSSGTTGQSGIFLQDAASLAAIDALDALRLRGSRAAQPELGLWGLGRRFAYVGAIGGPCAGHVSMERLRRLYPAPWGPQIDLISVLEPLPLIAARLHALQPDVLITYPSCASSLAACQRDGSLDLKLDELWLGGEQLSAVQRSLLQHAFNGTVRNSYGASEFYSIAFECAEGRLHLNDDWLILEGLDAAGQPVAPDTFSRTTLLTNLANHLQPLLRYRLTDRVRWVSAPCPCGSAFPVIEVQGRCDDSLSLPALAGGHVTLLPLVLETVLEEGAGVTQFQLVLQRDGALALRLPAVAGAPEPSFARCRQVLRNFLAAQGVRPVRLVHAREEPQRNSGSGKLRRVIDLSRHV